MTYPSSRRHPRTLAEAWQRPPARSSTIAGPYTRPPRRWWRLAALCALAAGFAAYLFG